MIAMSGGVDSTVAAYLMGEAGWDCIGVTMKLFDLQGEAGGDRSCCSLNDVNDARDAAFRLGIPHYVVNMRDAFRREVIDRFVSVYAAGGTPNPCIDCNRYLKFALLRDKARALECAALATGHYARIERSGGRWLLRTAADARKDQTYFLYAMTQRQLRDTSFPLGALRKDEVRGIALERGFINARKRDSQDICFCADGDYAAFIERYTGRTWPEGDIVDGAGNVLGRHRGHIRYTAGQRRGLGVSASAPLYVSAKCVDRNTVTLAPEAALYSGGLVADGLNLIACDTLERPLRVRVKTRYAQEAAGAVAVQTGADEVRVDFDEPQRAVTAGQAAVFYDGGYVVGGGTIREAIGG